MELFLLRALERVIAVIIGGLSIYLGYRLFLAVKATGEGTGEVKLPGNVAVMVSRVGPGVFFALFGAVVVGASLAFPVRYNETELKTVGGTSVQKKDISGIGAESAISSAASTSGIDSEGAPDQEALEFERLRVREHIAFLNQLMRLVHPALPEAQRQRVRAKTLAAKLQLMHAVWGQDWGRFEDFQLWAEGGGKAVDSVHFAGRRSSSRMVRRSSNDQNLAPVFGTRRFAGVRRWRAKRDVPRRGAG
jgi:hypothetical protein